jgi:two-component system, cell cycle response regulator DivK
MMKLLLVEDNRDNAQLFIRILETAGYDVTHTTRGLEGLKMARRQPYQVILLDFDLPDIDGSQVGLSLRKSAKAAAIIALTAKADKTTRNKAKLFGFNAFISKPCTDEDLLNTIKAVLEIQQGARAQSSRMPLQ